MISLFEKGTLIKKYFPKIAQEIVKEGNYSYNGLLILPGTKGRRHFIGNPTNWTNIKFENKEYLYSLNRMKHLRIMSEAFAITQDIKYADKIAYELELWLDKITPPTVDESNIEAFNQCTPWRALEVGSRAINSWPSIIECLSAAGLLNTKLHGKIISSIKVHMEILYRISPLLWPQANHNHYLIENIGLLSLAVHFPNLDNRRIYITHAEQELKRCFDAQYTSEGGQIEGSPSYHNACLFWFSLAAYLSHRNDLFPMQKLNKMFEYSIYATRNTGGNFPLGDSHGEDSETLLMPAISLYLLTKQTRYLSMAHYFYNKKKIDKELQSAIFLFPDIISLANDYQVAISNKLKPNLPRYTFQKTLGQAFLRTGWESKDASLGIICKSPVQNRHSHIDPGSIDYTALGKALIVDPGIYTYKESKERYYFKSTGSHSTISINGKDAWEYLGSWKYGEQKNSHLSKVKQIEDCLYATMEINNYEPIRIKRTVVLVENNDVLIIDDIDNCNNDVVNISFNINTQNIRVIGNKAYTEDEGANVLIMTSSFDILTQAAKYSPKIDIKKPSTMVRLHSKIIGHTLHTTLIHPFLLNDINEQVIETEINKDGYAIRTRNTFLIYNEGEIYVENTNI